MKYFSTNNPSHFASLKDAVKNGLAPDKGLYMPEFIPLLEDEFIGNIHNCNFVEIATTVAKHFFEEDIPVSILENIVAETLNFEIPLIEIEKNIFALELFHGPTLAFKDVGARFMSRVLSYFVKHEKEAVINVLVATSGDTGSAVANGFLGVEGIKVYVLYPSGKVSAIQEAQFCTLGNNITALQVDGTFDDCQALVKEAFMDEHLKAHINITSANSINIARLLPQSFYYFYAYAQLAKQTATCDLVVAVPCGNLGNLTAGVIAKKMGLPIKRFIAANNQNNVFADYISTAQYHPRKSVFTVANAMDVGAPSNFDRLLAIYKNSYTALSNDIKGYAYEDDAIKNAIKNVYANSGYLLDPHGACAYMALKENLNENEKGIFLATAHPAKFMETVELCVGEKIKLPPTLEKFMERKKQSYPLANDYAAFKKMLINHS